MLIQRRRCGMTDLLLILIFAGVVGGYVVLGELAVDAVLWLWRHRPRRDRLGRMSDEWMPGRVVEKR